MTPDPGLITSTLLTPPPPPPPPCQENIFYISDSAWLGICRSDFYTKRECRSEKSPFSCLAESNPLRSRCWISRWSNPSPQWVPAYQHSWSMDRTICLLCSPMCETRSFVYVMCETSTASSPPLHQRTGEFLSSVPGEQSCWSCIFLEPCSTSLELFTCWRLDLLTCSRGESEKEGQIFGKEKCKTLRQY